MLKQIIVFSFCLLAISCNSGGQTETKNAKEETGSVKDTAISEQHDQVSVQDETTLYKKIFQAGDSLSKSSIKGELSNDIFDHVAKLDQKHPAEFYNAVGDFLQKSKFNDASLIYYIGYVRYKYYNSANPDYQASNDGALLGSFHSIFGEPIQLYLRTDIENYIKILEKCKDWIATHDFEFYSKNKNLVMYGDQLDQLEHMIKDLNSNRKTYQKQWDKETLEFKKMFAETKK